MPEAIYTDKMLDMIALACRPGTRQITHEGVIRSTKTVVSIEEFFWAVYFAEGRRHLAASYDTDTLNNNILIADGFGLLTRFAEYCSDLKKDKIGAHYIEIKSPNGIKKVTLCSYSNKSKWKKVLGGTIEKILIDECNTADKQFINECYSRQVSCDNPLTIYTLNGDVPTHPIYDYINCSRILGKCPASIRAEMSKASAKPGYFYTHWTMADNPAMTAEKIAKAHALYPVGSHYHTIKILGERGAPGKLIYVDYIDEAKLIQKIDIAKYHSFTVSMDVGATRAQNSITLIGYLPGCRGAAVIDKQTFQQVGYNEKTEKLINFISKWRNLGARNIEGVIVDSAESNYIADLKGKFETMRMPDVTGSYKATIKDRIDMCILLMSAGKLLFNDTDEGKKALGAFKEATWLEDKIGKERKDENEPWNDILDSIEYGLTFHMKELLMSVKGAG